MKAANVMAPILTYLRPEDGVQEFVKALKDSRSISDICGTRTVPVINSHGNLVGILSITNILKAVYPRYLSTADLSAFTWDGMFRHHCRRHVG